MKRVQKYVAQAGLNRQYGILKPLLKAYRFDVTGRTSKGIYRGPKQTTEVTAVGSA